MMDSLLQQILKDLGKGLGGLCSAHGVFSVDDEEGDPGAVPFRAKLPSFRFDGVPSEGLVLQQRLDGAGWQPGCFGTRSEDGLISQALLVLEVGFKEGVHEPM